MKKGIAAILGLCAGVLLFAGCETGTQPAAQDSLPTEQEMREYYTELPVHVMVKVEEEEVEEREDAIPGLTLTTESAEYPADVKEIPLTLTNTGKDLCYYDPYPELHILTTDGWYGVAEQGNPSYPIGDGTYYREENYVSFPLEGETTENLSPPFVVQFGEYDGGYYGMWSGDKTLLPGHYRIVLPVSRRGGALAETGGEIFSCETVEFDIVA